MTKYILVCFCFGSQCSTLCNKYIGLRDFNNIFVILLSKRRKAIVFTVVLGGTVNTLVAGLTNDKPEITAPISVQYNALLPSAASTASVSFPPSSDTFRYVIIQRQSSVNEPICLTEVKVFLRGICTFWSFRTILTIIITQRQIGERLIAINLSDFHAE